MPELSGDCLTINRPLEFESLRAILEPLRIGVHGLESKGGRSRKTAIDEGAHSVEMSWVETGIGWRLKGCGEKSVDLVRPLNARSPRKAVLSYELLSPFAPSID